MYKALPLLLYTLPSVLHPNKSETKPFKKEIERWTKYIIAFLALQLVFF